MALSPNARRLAAAIEAAEPAGGTPAPWFAPATVATVTAGAGYGGATLVEVDWLGGRYAVPYLDSYTPTVGHTVLLLIQRPQAVIFGRVVGRPPTT
jgi:hypothetical protein